MIYILTNNYCKRSLDLGIWVYLINSGHNLVTMLYTFLLTCLGLSSKTYLNHCL